MLSQVFAYVQNHQIACIQYKQIFVYQLYLNKAVKEESKKERHLIQKAILLAWEFNISCEDFSLWGHSYYLYLHFILHL